MAEAAGRDADVPRSPLSDLGLLRQAEDLYVRPDAANASPFRQQEFEAGTAALERNRRAQGVTDQTELTGGLAVAGGVGSLIDRFTGAPIRGALQDPNPVRGAIRGFYEPDVYARGRNLPGINRLPDEDLYGERRFLPDNLSLRDIGGTVGEAVFDVGTVAGVPGDVARLGARGARAGARAARHGADAATPTLRRLATEEAGGIRLPSVPENIIPEGAVSQPVAENLLGLRPIEPGLTTSQRAFNALRETTGLGTLDDPIATPAMAERARVQPIIQSQAARVGETSRSLIADSFEVDDVGRVPAFEGIDPNLPGAPSIQDIAARLPLYESVLTPPQRQALEELRRLVEPYQSLLDETGVERRLRADVMEGGFYLPRGSAAVGDADAPIKVRAGRGMAGSKAGFERAATFDSMAQGIDAGFVYPSVDEALRSYAEAAGRRAADQHVTNYFLAQMDELGNPLGQTAADRVNPALRARVESLRARIAGRGETFNRRVTRQTAQERAAVDAEHTADTVEGIRGGRETAFDARRGLSTEEAIAAAERELRAFRRASNKVEDAAQTARGRAERTAIGAAQTFDERAAFMRELEEIKGAWQQAQRVAAQTPRDRGTIGLSGLQGHAFPDEVANAANKVLKGEGSPAGRGSSLIRATEATNLLLRGLRATADVSFIGIQGLIGLTNNPRAYSRALTVAIKSLADDTVFGSFLRTFDEAATAAGKPTSAQWAQDGLRIGGARTEFSIGQGLGRASDAVANAPVVRQSNRSFGAFGDTLRLAWADAMYNGSRSTTDIAASVNRFTGTTGRRFGGEVGDLAFFAPRFFQAQLETAALMAGRGTQANLARRNVLQMVGLGVLTTVAINEALSRSGQGGLPLDDVFDRESPNFMRFRLRGRDYSLFGPWDSLLKATMAATEGDFSYIARTKASPAVGMAWDLIAGEDFMGRDVRQSPEAFAQWLVRQFVPFSASDLPEIAGEATEDPLGAAVSLGAELSGVKSSPVSPTDELDALTEGGDFYAASPAEQERIRRENPELWQRAVERGGDERQQVEALRERLFSEQQMEDARLESGAISIDEWNANRKARDLELSTTGEAVYGEMGDRDPDPSKPWEVYWSKIDEAEERYGGMTDEAWEDIDAFRATLTPEQNAAIDENTGVRVTPLVRERREAVTRVEEAGLFELRDETWKMVREAYPWVGDHATYQDWYRAEVESTVTLLREQGHPEETLRQDAEAMVDRMDPAKAQTSAMSDMRDLWLQDQLNAGNVQAVGDAFKWGWLEGQARRDLFNEFVAP
jgi:hypothetical protein